MTGISKAKVQKLIKQAFSTLKKTLEGGSVQTEAKKVINNLEPTEAMRVDNKQEVLNKKE